MNDVDVEVRAADQADIGALATIGQNSFTATYAALSDAGDVAAHLDAYFSRAAIGREMAMRDRRYLLATVDGKPAGLAKIREGDCPEAIPHKGSMELQQLYVLPDYQRYGIGGHLIGALTRIAADTAATGIWLSVWEDADWATSFYRKAGFSEVGFAEFRIGKSVYTDLLMWRPVDPD